MSERRTQRVVVRDRDLCLEAEVEATNEPIVMIDSVAQCRGEDVPFSGA